MKKLFLSLALVAMSALSAMAQSQVKYVFYFIGDGMGVNQINVTETYLAALKGKIGTEPICMSSFPVVGMVNTYSATNGVTDSAAGGTALACGKKTKNGAIVTDQILTVLVFALHLAVEYLKQILVFHTTFSQFRHEAQEYDKGLSTPSCSRP